MMLGNTSSSRPSTTIVSRSHHPCSSSTLHILPAYLFSCLLPPDHVPHTTSRLLSEADTTHHVKRRIMLSEATLRRFTPHLHSEHGSNDNSSPQTRAASALGAHHTASVHFICTSRTSYALLCFQLTFKPFSPVQTLPLPQAACLLKARGA